MKSQFRIFSFCFLFFLFSFAFFNDGLAEELKIGGGAAPMNAILKRIKDPFEKATGIKLTLLEQGPKLALLELLKGNIDAAASGLTIEEWQGLMKKEGQDVNWADLQGYVIGKSRAVVIINKNNPVNKLSKEQLKGIFTGKIANWKEVGGPDMPIIVVWANLTPGMNSLYLKKALDGITPLKEVLEATTGPNLKQHVAANPEAIGITSSAVADETVKVPEQPLAESDITLVVKKNPPPALLKLIEFIKGEGQKYIKK